MSVEEGGTILACVDYSLLPTPNPRLTRLSYGKCYGMGAWICHICSGMGAWMFFLADAWVMLISTAGRGSKKHSKAVEVHSLPIDVVGQIYLCERDGE